MEKDYSLYFIDADKTIMDAIRQMDSLNVKLLIVSQHNNFKSLISIGDIQRAVIKYQSFDIKIENIIRKKIDVAYTDDNIEHIKTKMHKFRTEFMPVLKRETGELVKILFWDELFDDKQKKEDLNVPVVIMAGGKGERLKPITNIIPKPLIPVGEKPIIEIIINTFCKYGVTDFYISTNYKEELIKNYFNSIEHKPYSITYISEEKPLGTAGSLFMLKDKIRSTFFVSNCDILIDQNLNEVLDYHLESKNELTIIAAMKNYTIPYGTLKIGANGMLLEMEEKPENTFFINTGMYILEPQLLNEIPDNEHYHITALIQSLKNQKRRIGVFPITEDSWMDIGEWKEYNRTQEIFGKRFKDLA